VVVKAGVVIFINVQVSSNWRKRENDCKVILLPEGKVVVLFKWLLEHTSD
jgi:hypothetical protein